MRTSQDISMSPSPSPTPRRRLAKLIAVSATIAIAMTGATIPTVAGALPPKVGDLLYEGVIADGVFLSAKRLAVDPTTGNVFVTDTTNDKLYKLSRYGTLLGQRGGLGSASGLFDNPHGVAVDLDGYVYVADTANNRIQKFTAASLSFVKAWGTKGDGDDNVEGPLDVAVDGSGKILVADTNNQRIHKFGPNGGHIKDFGNFGLGSYFKYPAGVASVPGGSGNVLIADTENDSIKVFGPTYNYLTEYGKSGVELNQYDRPMGLAVEKSGMIYVADYDNKRIQKLNAQGAAVAAYPLQTKAQGLAFDEGLGRLYTTNGTDLLAYRKATAPAFVQGPASTGNVDAPYSSTLTGSGFPAVTGFTVVSGQLPPGLVLNGSKISGTPTKVGSYQFTLRVDNGVQTNVTKAYTITISPALTAPIITDGPYPTAWRGAAYNSLLKASGYPVPKFSVSSGSLPPGLALVGSSITGSATTEGEYSFTLKAENGIAPASFKQYKITVVPPLLSDVNKAPTISTTALGAGRAGFAYSKGIVATGVPTPTLSITSGALPAGLVLSGNTIKGVPRKAGTFAITVQAKNVIAPAASRQFTIKIYKASSKVSAKFSTKYPRAASTRIKARIKLSAPYTTGLSKTGKVRVYYGKKRVKTYTIKASNKGVIKVRLPKFSKKGKTKVTLRYLGNSQLKSAKRTIYVRVR